MNFSTKSVSRVLGISVRRIDYWDRTHLIKPSVREAAGYGSVRLYSFNDLIQLKVAKALLDGGISLQKIRRALSYLRKNMPEIKKPFSELRFLTDGETIFVLTKDTRKIIDALKSRQVVLSIALGDIVENLKTEVITLQEEKKYKVAVRGKKYEVVLRADPEDGGYWVECPALHGCASQGDTLEEALDMIKDAIEGHLQIVEEKRKAKEAA